MIHDANLNRLAVVDRTFDACVIGAGPAGITLARTLAAAGLEVALMEAGGLEYSDDSQDCYVGENVGRAYFPIEASRLRYLGGTSNHWGGTCRPLDAIDFRERPYLPLSGWPIAKTDLDPFEQEAMAILDVDRFDRFVDYPVDGPDDLYFRMRYGRSGPTRFGEKYHDELAASERIHLVLNANLVDLRLDDALATMTEARFRNYDPADPGFAVTARFYALCTGGIENARLLLNARSQVPEGIGNRHDNVGRYFCEHPHVFAGEVVFEQPRFWAVRFGPTEAHMLDKGLVNHSVRLVAILENELHFGEETLRSAFCLTPFRDRLAQAVLGQTVECDGRGLPAYLAQRTDPKTREGSIELQLEQALDRDSRVTLTDDKDAFGLNRIALDWRLNEVDLMTARTSALGFARYIAQKGIGRARLNDWLLRDDWREATETNQLIGSWHHMCTTRMCDDPRFGVVDSDCRVHGLDNLYVGGSSVFATPGQAVPTYSIVQLSLRLGGHLAERMQDRLQATAPDPACSDAPDAPDCVELTPPREP